MPTILELLDTAFRKAIHDAFGFDADPLLSVSQNDKFGDYQSNAAMGLAKQVEQKTGAKTNPRAVAEQVKAKLDLGDIATEVTIAGPGFLNVRLSPQWLAKQVEQRRGDPWLGVPKRAVPQTVVVDYSGPNVAKQMHVGHLRSTIIGDAISRVLEFEQDRVIRQNHIGDWGTQFGMLIAFLTWTGIGSDAHIEDLEDFYRRAKKKFDAEPEFQEQARATVVRLQGGGVDELAAWKRIVDETRRDYQPVYERLGVKLRPEHERGESFYNQRLADVVRELKEKKIAVESEGATVVFVPGYENPLIIQKSDGGYLYGTTDLAAIKFRTTELRAHRIIYTHDSRQAQHFAQVFWTAKQAGWAEGVSLEYAPFGTMLGEDGKPFATRKADIEKLRDLLTKAEKLASKVVAEKNPELPEEQRDEIARAVGIGAVKYADLSKDRTSDYIFSWDKMLAMDGNTAPYLQYAHARIKSIFRRAAERAIAYDAGAPVTLEAPHEIALVKHVLRFGEILDLIARELKPHHLTTYLYELATRFSGFFENCPVIQSEDPVRSSRLVLCDVTARTLATGLDLLGIEHPEQM
jgi:arginyl-tRNA synthetase